MSRRVVASNDGAKVLNTAINAREINEMVNDVARPASSGRLDLRGQHEPSFSDIRRLGRARHDEIRTALDTSASLISARRLRLETADLAHALRPAHRAGRTAPEPLARASARLTGIQRGNQTFPEIFRKSHATRPPSLAHSLSQNNADSGIRSRLTLPGKRSGGAVTSTPISENLKHAAQC